MSCIYSSVKLPAHRILLYTAETDTGVSWAIRKLSLAVQEPVSRATDGDLQHA